ncbi:MAG: beta-galactosidase trimerization domain-containing protein [Planctomycetota bacterium]
MFRRQSALCVTVLSLLVMTALPVLGDVGVAFLQEQKEVKPIDGGKNFAYKFDFLSLGAQFQLTYDISITDSTPSGKCSSRMWVFKEKMPTLGMTRPASCNWYAQGFFDVIIDGEGLHEYPATFDVLRRGGPDTLLQATWDTPKGKVAVRFLLRDGDDKLLMQAALEPKTEPKSIQLRLLCYPNGFYGDKDRWISTATRAVQHANQVQLDPAKEPWIVYYDKALTGDKTVGPCGLLYLPEEVGSASVNVTSYPIWTELNYPASTRKFHAALYDFAEIRENETNIAYLKANGERFVGDLRAAAAAGWDNVVGMTAKLPAGRIKEQTVEIEPTAFDKMTNEVVTPHIKWAKPYAMGTIKVLVLAPRWTQRETVELAERLDIDYDTICFTSGSQVHDPHELEIYGSYALYGYPPRSAIAELSRLRKALEDGRYDCMVIGGVQMELLPQYFFDAVMKKVSDGMGLLVTGHSKMFREALKGKELSEEGFRLRAVPVQYLPVLKDFSEKEVGKKPIFDSYTHGKGRVLIANYSGGANLCLTPSAARALEFRFPDYEYFQSLAAKAVLWAARKEPNVAVESVAPDGKVSVRATGDVKGVELAYVIHDRDLLEESSGKLTLDIPAGQSVHAVAIPRLKPGEHFLDVFLRKDGKVLDWGTGYSRTESTVAIEGIQIEAGERKEGSILRGRVVLKGTPAGAKMEVQLWDNLDRLLGRAQTTLDANAKEAPFEFKLPRPLTMLHRVRAVLLDEKGILDQRDEESPIPDSDWDDWSFLVWSNGANDAVRDGINYVSSQWGVDAIDNTGLTGGDAATALMYCRNAARHNLRSVPYITRIASMQEAGDIRKPCLTDPKHLETWTDGLKERTRGAAPFGPLGYTLGDENFLVNRKLDVCFSETCKADFRTYLQKVYSALDALNKEWDANYTSWEQVEPIHLEDAQKTKQYARWADHRMHMEDVFTRAHALGRKAIREVDTRARVGFDGVFGLDSWHGYNFYNLCQACDLCQVYRGRMDQVEYLRCFSIPGSLMGAWHNHIGNKDEISAKRVSWHLLFHGFNSSWYWTTYNSGCATCFPDLRPTPQLKWMAEVNQEIKGGIGKLMMNAKRLHDGVAIHYSQPSVHAHTLLGAEFRQVHDAAIVAVEDLGLQFDFVATEQIEKGKLLEYRVLLLPESFAVSEKEAAAIRSFVEKGGLLLADIRPGIMDGHCKPRAAGALDEVFGVKQGAERKLAGENEKVLLDAAELPVAPGDAGLELAGATASAKGSIGGSPCVTMKQFGKGMAILLNFPLTPYYKLRETCKEEPIRTLLRQRLAEEGVVGRFKVLCDGRDLNACEIAAFKNGGIEYVAIVKDDDIEDPGDRDSEVVFPSKSFVYDVRAKKMLGETDRVKTRITPGDPKIFALMPYTVQGVSVKADKNKHRPGETIEYEIVLDTSAGKTMGQHCIHLDVADPKGNAMRHYARNILLDGPRQKGKLDLALNDPAGNWRLQFTDVISGRSAMLQIDVEE